MGAGYSSRKDIVEKGRRERRKHSHPVCQAFAQQKDAVVGTGILGMDFCAVRLRQGEY